MKKIITTTDIDNRPFRITISTDGCGGNPYFSITADGYQRCGCLHEEILQYRADLKMFVDLHLSNLNGIPMHAEANGWYWLAKACGIPQRWEPEQSAEKCLQIFREHVRLSFCDDIVFSIQKEYMNGWQSVATEEFVSARCEEERAKVGAEKARKLWGKICEGMKDRWKREADAALALLQASV